jgi:RNA polymerase sigma factor (sigma-70 family)
MTHPISADFYGQAYSSGYLRTLRFLASLGASHEAAEEISQAAWVKGWEFRHQIRKVASIPSWVNSIAKNMLRSHVRRQHTLPVPGERQTFSVSEPISKIEVHSLLDRCRDSDRHLLQRYYIEGYSASEIAHEIGLTSSAVRVRLLRIRRVCHPSRLGRIKRIVKGGLLC